MKIHLNVINSNYKMDILSFELTDAYLLKQNSKIIHQIWFGNIPTKREAKKTLVGLKKYQESWVMNNPLWAYKCWNLDDCRKLIKEHFPEHLSMYDSYPYQIQRCDCVRYFILYRYGGLYADMDYCCVKPWDTVMEKYTKGLYIVETPNKIANDVHVSNSLMFSVKGHVFWKHVFIEMQRNKNQPVYYGKHMTVMYTTGPCIVNRMFIKHGHNRGYYPYRLFHPFGITTDIHITDDTDIYAYHLQQGSWSSFDSKVINFFYREYKFLLFIILIKLIPYFLL
jgi:mannosyltransferase OCH1-like enzyme